MSLQTSCIIESIAALAGVSESTVTDWADDNAGHGWTRRLRDLYPVIENYLAFFPASEFKTPPDSWKWERRLSNRPITGDTETPIDDGAPTPVYQEGGNGLIFVVYTAGGRVLSHSLYWLTDGLIYDPNYASYASMGAWDTAVGSNYGTFVKAYGFKDN